VVARGRWCQRVGECERERTREAKSEVDIKYKCEHACVGLWKSSVDLQPSLCKREGEKGQEDFSSVRL